MDVGVQRVEANKKIYSCPFDGCTSVFDRPYRLAQHRLVHVNVKPFACVESNCEKAYTSKSHLDRHIKTVHKETEVNVLFCCPKCMKKYVNRQNLKRHIKVSHIDNNKPFCCALCRLYFKKKHQLTAHMFIHNGIKPFRCPMCERDFITLGEKKKHMRNHKTYRCEHCEAKFTRWTELMQHKRVDHISPEYICHDCGKVFKERGHIIRHVKKHMPNTPVTIFFCPYDNCFRHYSRSNNLKQHILVKHEGMTFDCSLCGAKLSTKAKLNEHVVRHDRPQVIDRVHKTLKTGRKKRKDAGTIRYETAVRLAGIVKQKIEEGISRLYTESMNQDNRKSDTSNTPNNHQNIGAHNFDKLNKTSAIDVKKSSNLTNDIKVETKNSNRKECMDFKDPPEKFDNRKFNSDSTHQDLQNPKANFSFNIKELLNKPSKNLNVQGQIDSDIHTQSTQREFQVKIEADTLTRPCNANNTGITSKLDVQAQDDTSEPHHSTDFHAKEYNTQQRGYQNETNDFQKNIEPSLQSMPSSSSANTLSALLQLYWRTVLNYQDV